MTRTPDSAAKGIPPVSRRRGTRAATAPATGTGIPRQARSQDVPHAPGGAPSSPGPVTPTPPGSGPGDPSDSPAAAPSLAAAGVQAPAGGASSAYADGTNVPLAGSIPVEAPGGRAGKVSGNRPGRGDPANKPPRPGQDARLAQAAAMSEDRGPDSLDAHVRRLMKDLGLTGFHVEKSLDVEKNRKNVSVKGWPDWTIRGPRGVLFRELKAQRGRVAPEQQEWLDALTAAGANAGVWRPASLLSGAIAAELAAISAWRVRRGSRCVCDAYGSCPTGCPYCPVCDGEVA